MRPIEISDFNAADEYVVEAMMQDGKFKVIGKVIIDNNLLNDDDLETIWDYANWETNGYEKMVVSNGVYKGLNAFSDGRMFYVITDDEVGVVNDNIMVRKHYDVNNGYYIKSSRLHKEQSKDLWCFGSCETITNEYKSNILHEVLCGKDEPYFLEGGEVWHDIDKFPMLDHTILVELQVKGSDGLIYRTQDVCVERADRFEPTMSFVPKRWAYAIDLAQCKKVEG